MLIQQHHINNALHIVTLLPNNYGALNTGLPEVCLSICLQHT